MVLLVFIAVSAAELIISKSVSQTAVCPLLTVVTCKNTSRELHGKRCFSGICELSLNNWDCQFTASKLILSNPEANKTVGTPAKVE